MSENVSPKNPSLRLAEVLADEFEQLHGHAPLCGNAPADPEARLSKIWSAVHQLPAGQAALCISGGGIRSATFGLGILHGLARCGLLPRFHYLSTVSGGGYIGGWLSAWIHRAQGGLTTVAESLAQPRKEERPNPEPEEIQNLRSYSNYLAPRLGLLSADSWTLVGVYLRNVLLNWMVILPLLAAALMLPWIYTAILMLNPPPFTNLPLWLAAGCLAIGIAYMGLNLPSSGNRRWGQMPFLLFCLLPLFLGSVFMTMYWAWFQYWGTELPSSSFFGLGPRKTWIPFVAFGVGIHLVVAISALLRGQRFRFRGLIVVVVSGAVGGALLWLAATQLFPQPIAVMELFTCFGIPLFMALLFSAIMVFTGITSRWTGDPDREWWGRATGWLLAVALGWMIISCLVVMGPVLFQSAVAKISTLSIGTIATALAAFAGRSASIPPNDSERETTPAWARMLSKVASFAAILALAVILILLVEGTIGLMRMLHREFHFVWKLDHASRVFGRAFPDLNVILYAPLWAVVGLALALALFGMGMALIINPNKFSLHATYRDRLIRAYLGASNPARNPNPFTGFDEDDNVNMSELWSAEKFGRKLLPVINLTLNLVGGAKLAWQERKAESFTVSPLHCGSLELGYRRSGGPEGKRYGGPRGLSLGTAVTISGAAASPNMGYHSSPLVTFLLTLLNIRLGAWLGNPGPKGDQTYHLGYPSFSVGPVIAEAFGLTNDQRRYVYLSDGGHFENLGLYEMVLRRCHFIVVSDAGQDPECSFADLGEAVRKVRIDFGISIEFEQMDIFPRGDDCERNAKGRNCAIGRIRYREVDGEGAKDGLLIYIKPACYGNEPRDIYEYFRRSKTFPHESTGDQFFSESQFESYRMLGVSTMEEMVGEFRGNFPAFARRILENHLTGSPAPKWLAEMLETEKLPANLA